MKSKILTAVMAAMLTTATSAYGWETEPQPVSSNSDATARAQQEQEQRQRQTQQSVASAVSITGPNVAKTGSSTSNGGGADVNTTNNNKLLYVQFPGQPPVAQNVVGVGGGTANGFCGPLRKVVRVPVEYAVKHFGGHIEKITLAGQFTEELDPVTDASGNVVEFVERENADGSTSQMGSISNQTGVVISSSMGSQAGIGGIGSSIGASASFGNSGTFTGLERMVALGLCEYSRYYKAGASENPEDLKKRVEQLQKDKVNLEGQLDRRLRQGK